MTSYLKLEGEAQVLSTSAIESTSLKRDNVGLSLQRNHQSTTENAI